MKQAEVHVQMEGFPWHFAKQTLEQMSIFLISKLKGRHRFYKLLDLSVFPEEDKTKTSILEMFPTWKHTEQGRNLAITYTVLTCQTRQETNRSETHTDSPHGGCPLDTFMAEAGILTPVPQKVHGGNCIPS